MAQDPASMQRPDPDHTSHEAEPDENFFTIRLDWQRWWSIIPEIIALTCAGALPVIVSANVVARYTNWYQLPWAEDVVKVLFLWIVFLGGAIAVKYGAHVRMTIVSDRMGTSGLGALWNRVIRLSPMVAGVLLLVLGTRLVEISMRRELPTLEISVGYFMTIVPISGALMILYVARDFWVAGRRQRGGEGAS
ncbi:MAG TPA: TRAP transporter small permease [Hyphomicrobiaceae bacterium]|nr:TRAP transporter small permease [Hyphomicrobiaceae bacterium]